MEDRERFLVAIRRDCRLSVFSQREIGLKTKRDMLNLILEHYLPSYGQDAEA